MTLLKKSLLSLLTLALGIGLFVLANPDSASARGSVRMTFYVASWGNDSRNNLGNNKNRPLRSLSKAIEQATRADYGTIEILDTMYTLPATDLNLRESINFGSNVTIRGRQRSQTLLYNPHNRLAQFDIDVVYGRLSISNLYFNDVVLDVEADRSSYVEIAGNDFSLYRAQSNQPLLKVKTNGSSAAKIHQNDFRLNGFRMRNGQAGILSQSNGTGGSLISSNKFHFYGPRNKKLVGVEARGATAGYNQTYLNSFYARGDNNTAFKYDDLLGMVYFVSNNLNGFNGQISKQEKNQHMHVVPPSQYGRLTEGQSKIIQSK